MMTSHTGAGDLMFFCANKDAVHFFIISGGGFMEPADFFPEFQSFKGLALFIRKKRLHLRSEK